MTKRLFGILLVVILFTATPASARTIVVDRGRANGKFVAARAEGSVNGPRALFVKVKSRPTDLRVRVLWNTFCSGGSNAGDFYARTAVVRQVRTSANPGTCSFAATAQLRDGGGRITVILLARI
jgi:hypothetical protein